MATVIIRILDRDTNPNTPCEFEGLFYFRFATSHRAPTEIRRSQATYVREYVAPLHRAPAMEVRTFLKMTWGWVFHTANGYH